MSITVSKTIYRFDTDRFGEAMPDGRLTESSDGKKYRLRDAIKLKESLGRILTPEEFAAFEIK